MVQAVPPSLKRLSRLLQTNEPGPLASLVAEVHKLRELDATLKSVLEGPLKNKVRVAALRERTLVIQADSSVWAARTRYMIPDILKKFNKLYKDLRLQSIRVRVAPAVPDESRKTARRVMPRAAADCLRATAAGIGDAGLKAALERLAANAEE